MANRKKLTHRGFILERPYVLLRNGPMDFSNSPLLKRLTCFQYFEKTGVPMISSANESATFPYKNALSKANVKTN